MAPHQLEIGAWVNKAMVAFIPIKVPRSSNGRTAGSGPANWGSSPYLGTNWFGAG